MWLGFGQNENCPLQRGGYSLPTVRYKAKNGFILCIQQLLYPQIENNRLDKPKRLSFMICKMEISYGFRLLPYLEKGR